MKILDFGIYLVLAQKVYLILAVALHLSDKSPEKHGSWRAVVYT